MDIVFISVILIVGLVGAWAFLSQYNNYIPWSRVTRKLSKKDEKVDIFRATGLGITLRQYNIIRYVLYVVVLALITYQYYKVREIPTIALLLYVLFLVVSNPSIPKISIVPVMLMIAKKTRSKTLNDEVLRAFIQLKNLALIDTKLNAYEIMRKLLRHTHVLKPYLADVIKNWHTSEKREKALETFRTVVGTVDAANFAKVLVKLDTTRPIDLLDELTFNEQQIMEIKQTARETSNETTGNVFYSLVYIVLMAVLINFIVVVVMGNMNFNFV